MNNNPVVEKRHHHRLTEGIRLRITFAGDGTVYKGLPSDLSPTGARLRIPRSVKIDQRIHIHILFSTKEIGCEGQVCWVKPMPDGDCIFGVRFMELQEYERAFLENAIGNACIG